MVSFRTLKINKSRCFPLRLDFRMDVAHGLSSRNYTENVFVELESDEGLYGYGECVPRDYVTGETANTAIVSIARILPYLNDLEFVDSSEVIRFLENQEKNISSDGNINRASFCAFELALLDLAGKTWKRPVSELLGLSKQKDTLFYSLVLPLLKMENLAVFLESAKNYKFPHVKVKVDAIDPGERVRKIKGIIPDSEIRVDANCSWNRDNAHQFFREMSDLGVVSIEQPLASDDLEGTAALKKSYPVAITLDESAWTVESVKKVAEINACDIINVRISKCGGLIGALNVIRTAEEHGLGIQMGAHVGESCILSSAGAQLAASIPGFRWIEGFFGKHLLIRDLCLEDLRFGLRGQFTPLERAGLGIEVDRTILP